MLPTSQKFVQADEGAEWIIDTSRPPAGHGVDRHASAKRGPSNASGRTTLSQAAEQSTPTRTDAVVALGRDHWTAARAAVGVPETHFMNSDISPDLWPHRLAPLPATS